MPIFKKADDSVTLLAADLMKRFEPHMALVLHNVRVDIVMAAADLDERGNPINDAIRRNGRKALGFTRAVPAKERAMGRGDAEITLDGDWWEKALPEEQEAVLDHELHHISIKTDRHGNVSRDDSNRPLIKLRKHDIEVGWFNVIAERHGAASQERIQAKAIMDNAGQYFWPDIAPRMEISAGGEKVILPAGQLRKVLGAIAKSKTKAI